MFNTDDVKKQLDDQGLNGEKLVQKFWRIDSYDTVLNYQPLVDHLITFVKERGDTDFTKFEFYRYFFNQVTRDKVLDRKKLWELALAIETQQKNEFKVSEFMAILDKLGLSKSELASANLIVEKDGNAGFFHHTVSEYLVAEKWIGEGKVKGNLNGILVKESGEIFAINNSWYGVVRFLLDSDEAWNETYSWSWNLALTNQSVVDEGFSETITSIDRNRLSVIKRSELFGLMFGAYLKKRIWTPLWTMAALPSFCEVKDYEKLKKLVVETKESEPNFLTTIGNILGVVSRLMEDESTLINSDEKNWWRGRLVGFANSGDENGVVQRHALSALSNYKGDLGLIEEVNEDLLKHESNLVREAYLDFCSDIDPNSEVVINKLIKGLTEAGEEIYSRHGLYKISKQHGLLFFLKRLDEDEKFLELFLDKESIFNSRDRNGDEVLIKRIREFIDDEAVNVLKSIVKKSLESKEIYYQERSYFIRSLVSTVDTADQKYIDEVLTYLEGVGGDKAMRVYDYIPYFAWVLNSDNVEKIYKKLIGIDERSGRFGQQAIYRARYESEIGKGAYSKAVTLKIVEEVKEKDWSLEQTNSIYKQFRKYLGSEAKKTYYPAVFQYFHQNIEKLTAHKYWKNDKKRLLKLVVEEGLNKIDPKGFKLTITKGEDGRRTNQYSISSVASYYGDVIKTANLLGLSIEGEVRQRVINFIPFSYNDDWNVIWNAVGEMSDEDLKWVNSQYTEGTEIRYFHPDSYIYFAKVAADERWNLQSPKEVLVIIAEDMDIDDSSCRYALEVLGEYIDDEDIYIKERLNDTLRDKTTEKIADDLLISIFKDRPAIERRIKQIKDFAKKAKGFKQPQGGHSVGEIEDELMEMHLARCFISAEDASCKYELMSLVDYSFKLLSEDKDQYWSSTHYLWGIFKRYFSAIKEKELSILTYIDGFYDAKKDEYELIDGSNWFRSVYEDVRKLYFGSEVDFDSDVKLVVILEGPTDVENVNSSIKRLGWKYRNMIKTRTPAPNVNGRYCSNRDTMRHASESDLANPEDVKTPRLYLIDIGESCVDRSSNGRIFRKSIANIPNNPLIKGIENLFTKRTLNKVSKKSTCVVKKQNIFSKSIEYEIDKKSLCLWLSINGTVADYKHFKTNILGHIESVLAELQSLEKRD